MACGDCNQYKPKAADKFSPKRLANGVYETYFWQGCDRPYNGRYRGDAVYVVAIGTENERIFRRAQRGEGVRYARSINATVDSFAVTQLCEDAMLELFGE